MNFLILFFCVFLGALFEESPNFPDFCKKNEAGRRRPRKSFLESLVSNGEFKHFAVCLRWWFDTVEFKERTSAVTLSACLIREIGDCWIW
jgi:hypothetical protein